MALYATIQEIKDSSPNVPVIANGSDADILRWGSEAFVRINGFCRQSFLFEQQTTKLVQGTYHPSVFLPKLMSGDVTIYAYGAGQTPRLVNGVYDLEVHADAGYFRYNPRNLADPSRTTIQFEVTADWGYAPDTLTLVMAAANDLYAKYDQHRSDTAFHLTYDDTNVVSEAPATDLTTATTILNDLRATYNAHVVDTAVHEHVGIDLVTAPDASTLGEAVVLAADIKRKFNNHLLNGSSHLVLDELNTVKTSVTNTIMPDEIKLAFFKVTQRIAIRDNPDDLRYHNSGFSNESWGDGYSYSLSNADLRSLIHPNDAVLLWEHVNSGRTVG